MNGSNIKIFHFQYAYTKYHRTFVMGIKNKNKVLFISTHHGHSHSETMRRCVTILSPNIYIVEKLLGHLKY